MLAVRFCAGLPHAKNTTPGPGRFVIVFKIASVNSSQPFLLWEFAACARTLSDVFSNKTPCLAQEPR